jgi:acyl carrier protein
MNEDIVSKLTDLVAKNILKKPDRIIKPDEPLLSSGLIDSFSLIDMALLVEDNFGVRIDDSELNSSTFDSLNQLANIIQSRRS